jgi:hypothetical protein
LADPLSELMLYARGAADNDADSAVSIITTIVFISFCISAKPSLVLSTMG